MLILAKSFLPQLVRRVAVQPVRPLYYISDSLNTGVTSSHVQKSNSFSTEISVSKGLNNRISVKSFLNEANLSGNVIATMKTLDELVKMKTQIDGNIITEIEEHETIVRLLTTDSIKCRPGFILQTVDNLVLLGMDPAHHLIQSLQHDLLWKISSCSFRTVLKIFLNQVKFVNTEKQKEVCELAVAKIELLLKEVPTANEICSLYKYSSHFSTDFLTRVDSIVIMKFASFSDNEIISILYHLALSKRRPIQVIKKIVYTLFKKDCDLSMRQISKVLYALHSLSFPELLLVRKLFSSFSQNITNLTDPVIVSSVMNSMGKLLWKDEDVLEKLTSWIQNNLSACNSNILINYLLTIATLNYIPSNNVFEVILSTLPLKNLRDDDLISLVWSLAVLNKITEDQVNLVLNKCSSIDKFSSRIGLQLKLLNIDAIADTFPKYKGARLLKCNMEDLNVKLTQSSDKLSFSAYVSDILNEILESSSFKANVLTPMGVFISAELAVNNNGKALPLANYSENIAGTRGNHSKHVHPLALLCLLNKDYTIGIKHLTGANILAIRILKSKNYKVLEIPFASFIVKQKSKNVRELEYLIKRTVTDM